MSIFELQASQVAHMVKNLPTVWEIRVWSLDWKNPLEKGMATQTSFLAREFQTEKFGRL